MSSRSILARRSVRRIKCAKIQSIAGRDIKVCSETFIKEPFWRRGRKRVRSRPVVRSEAALAIYICRQHNKPHYRFWDLGLKGQALRQIRAPSELAPWVQARGWREIAFFRFFSLPAPAATDPPANFIHTLTNHSQGPGSNARHSMSQH